MNPMHNHSNIVTFIRGLKDLANNIADYPNGSPSPVKVALLGLIDAYDSSKEELYEERTRAEITRLKAEVERLPVLNKKLEAETAYYRSTAELNDLEVARLNDPLYRSAKDRVMQLDKRVMELGSEIGGLTKERSRLIHEVKELKKEKSDLQWKKAEIGKGKPRSNGHRPEIQKVTIGDVVAAKAKEMEKQQEKKKDEQKPEMAVVEAAQDPSQISIEDLERMTAPAQQA